MTRKNLSILKLTKHKQDISLKTPKKRVSFSATKKIRIIKHFHNNTDTDDPSPDKEEDISDSKDKSITKRDSPDDNSNQSVIMSPDGGTAPKRPRVNSVQSRSRFSLINLTKVDNDDNDQSHCGSFTLAGENKQSFASPPPEFAVSFELYSPIKLRTERNCSTRSEPECEMSIAINFNNQYGSPDETDNVIVQPNQSGLEREINYIIDRTDQFQCPDDSKNVTEQAQRSEIDKTADVDNSVEFTTSNVDRFIDQASPSNNYSLSMDYPLNETDLNHDFSSINYENLIFPATKKRDKSIDDQIIDHCVDMSFSMKSIDIKNSMNFFAGLDKSISNKEKNQFQGAVDVDFFDLHDDNGIEDNNNSERCSMVIVTESQPALERKINQSIFDCDQSDNRCLDTMGSSRCDESFDWLNIMGAAQSPDKGNNKSFRLYGNSDFSDLELGSESLGQGLGMVPEEAREKEGELNLTKFLLETKTVINGTRSHDDIINDLERNIDLSLSSLIFQDVPNSTDKADVNCDKSIIIENSVERNSVDILSINEIKSHSIAEVTENIDPILNCVDLTELIEEQRPGIYDHSDYNGCVENTVMENKAGEQRQETLPVKENENRKKGSFQFDHSNDSGAPLEHMSHGYTLTIDSHVGESIEKQEDEEGRESVSINHDGVDLTRMLLESKINNYEEKRSLINFTNGISNVIDTIRSLSPDSTIIDFSESIEIDNEIDFQLILNKTTKIDPYCTDFSGEIDKDGSINENIDRIKVGEDIENSKVIQSILNKTDKFSRFSEDFSENVIGVINDETIDKMNNSCIIGGKNRSTINNLLPEGDGDVQRERKVVEKGFIIPDGSIISGEERQSWKFIDWSVKTESALQSLNDFQNLNVDQDVDDKEEELEQETTEQKNEEEIKSIINLSRIPTLDLSETMITYSETRPEKDYEEKEVLSEDNDEEMCDNQSKRLSSDFIVLTDPFECPDTKVGISIDCQDYCHHDDEIDDKDRRKPTTSISSLVSDDSVDDRRDCCNGMGIATGSRTSLGRYVARTVTNCSIFNRSYQYSLIGESDPSILLGNVDVNNFSSSSISDRLLEKSKLETGSGWEQDKENICPLSSTDCHPQFDETIYSGGGFYGSCEGDRMENNVPVLSNSPSILQLKQFYPSSLNQSPSSSPSLLFPSQPFSHVAATTQEILHQTIDDYDITNDRDKSIIDRSCSFPSDHHGNEYCTAPITIDNNIYNGNQSCEIEKARIAAAHSLLSTFSFHPDSVKSIQSGSAQSKRLAEKIDIDADDVDNNLININDDLNRSAIDNDFQSMTMACQGDKPIFHYTNIKKQLSNYKDDPMTSVIDYRFPSPFVFKTPVSRVGGCVVPRSKIDRNTTTIVNDNKSLLIPLAKNEEFQAVRKRSMMMTENDFPCFSTPSLTADRFQSGFPRAVAMTSIGKLNRCQQRKQQFQPNTGYVSRTTDMKTRTRSDTMEMTTTRTRPPLAPTPPCFDWKSINEKSLKVLSKFPIDRYRSQIHHRLGEFSMGDASGNGGESDQLCWQDKLSSIAYLSIDDEKFDDERQKINNTIDYRPSTEQEIIDRQLLFDQLFLMHIGRPQLALMECHRDRLNSLISRFVSTIERIEAVKTNLVEKCPLCRSRCFANDDDDHHRLNSGFDVMLTRIGSVIPGAMERNRSLCCYRHQSRLKVALENVKKSIFDDWHVIQELSRVSCDRLLDRGSSRLESDFVKADIRSKEDHDRQETDRYCLQNNDNIDRVAAMAVDRCQRDLESLQKLKLLDHEKSKLSFFHYHKNMDGNDDEDDDKENGNCVNKTEEDNNESDEVKENHCRRQRRDDLMRFILECKASPLRERWIDLVNGQLKLMGGRVTVDFSVVTNGNDRDNGDGDERGESSNVGRLKWARVQVEDTLGRIKVNISRYFQQLIDTTLIDMSMDLVRKKFLIHQMPLLLLLGDVNLCSKYRHLIIYWDPVRPFRMKAQIARRTKPPMRFALFIDLHPISRYQFRPFQYEIEMDFDNANEAKIRKLLDEADDGLNKLYKMFGKLFQQMPDIYLDNFLK